MDVTATYTKLRRGGYGVRLSGIEGDVVSVGDIFPVEVTRKNGETEAQIVRVKWVGDDFYNAGCNAALCRIVRDLPEDDEDEAPPPKQRAKRQTKRQTTQRTRRAAPKPAVVEDVEDEVEDDDIPF